MALITFGTPVDSDADIDISALATGDWAIYQDGPNREIPAIRKSGGGSTIGNLTAPGGVASYVGDTRAITWTGGTPTGSGSSFDVVYDNASGAGAEISTPPIPVGLATRTIYLPITHYDGQTIRCTATLSDGSVSPTSVDLAGSTPNGSDSNGLFTVDVAAGSDGQTVVLKVSLVAAYSGDAIVGIPAIGWKLAAVSGNTGTLAWTEADDAMAASGAVGSAGSLAWTEADDVMAATGTIRTAGAIVYTEANDTMAAAGGVANTGTTAWTEANDINAASGTADGSATSNTGTIAWTEEDDVTAATGGVSSSGAAAWTEANDTMAATGGGAGGSLAWAEADDTMSASGTAGTITPPSGSVGFEVGGGRIIPEVSRKPLLQRILDARNARRVKPAKERAAKRARYIEIRAAELALEQGNGEQFDAFMRDWLQTRPVLPPQAEADPTPYFLAQVAFRLQQMQAEDRARQALRALEEEEEDEAIALLLL